jgi:hypothetical protein
MTETPERNMLRSLALLCILALILTESASAAVIRGHVRDGTTGEPMAAVVASLEGTEMGDLTNTDGYFVITDVPAGTYQLRLAAMGYGEFSRDVLVVGDTTITVDARLGAAPIAIKEVKITAQHEEFKRSVNVSSLTMSRGQIRSTPFVVESDLFRSLQSLPGMVATSDFSSASFVRGGNADQNLVLIDGVSVYNPTHLGGIFSVLDPDIVTSADLLTGGFPAEYGGRLSSVLDVVTRDGRSDHISGNLGSSLLATKILVEGPIPVDSSSPRTLIPRATFFFSGRRTYFDKLLSLFKFDFPYYFYDLNGKMTFNYNDNTKIALSGFWSSDQLNLGTGGSRVFLDWGNRFASIPWQQYWTPRLSSKTYLTYNNYYYDIDLAGGLISIHDTINEVALRTGTTYKFSGDNEITGGLEASYSTFRYNANMIGRFKFDLTGPPVMGSAYVEAKLKPFSSLLVEPGLRADYYYMGGELGTKYFRPSPRLSFKYFLNEITAIKGAVGRYHQYVSALYPEFSPIPSLFFWIPLIGSYQPQTADHFILGGERWLDENTNLTLEGYYKNFLTIHELQEQVKPESMGTTLLRQGKGYSWGADVMLKRDWGKLTGWLSYSLCFARVTFDGLTYPPSYDRRHIINVVASYALPWGITANAHFNYGSGLPYTATVGYFRRWTYWYPFNGYADYSWQDIGSGKNAARYPAYHRLDLGAEKSFNVGNTKLSVQLDVINVYNHQNLLLYQWDYDQPVPLRTSVNQFPILPSVGIKWNF